MNKIALYLNMSFIILNVQKDSLLYTGIELGEYAHHMNPSLSYFFLHFVCEYHH